MKCAYCNGPCDDCPVSYEAVCWSCHDTRLLEAGVRSWRERLRRLLSSVKAVDADD